MSANDLLLTIPMRVHAADARAAAEVMAAANSMKGGWSAPSRSVLSDEELFMRCREFVREQSEGEWDDKTIEADARKMAAFFRSLALNRIG